MKVIFIKDLKNQGKKGDIKEVKDGYAINFLIKNGYAVSSTKTSIGRLQNDIALEKANEEQKRKEANDLKNKLVKEKLIFKAKTGVNDKMFGSISSKQIADELNKLNYNFDKKKIEIAGEINTIGVHKVHICLYKDIIGEINIQVIKEK